MHTKPPQKYKRNQKRDQKEKPGQERPTQRSGRWTNEKYKNILEEPKTHAQVQQDAVVFFLSL